MSCHYPLTAWRSRDLDDVNPKTGKTKLVFREDQGWPNTKLELACGRCIGCKLDKARDWAIRCVHEASMHKENCFLTLTYRPENLPLNGSLNKRDIVLFIKRLRRRYENIRFKYFQCGEYGDLLGRPHHHVLIFGFNFPDRLPFKKIGGNQLYLSDELSFGDKPLWPHGFASIGDVTFDSACYVARYALKKITGEKSDDHYKGRLPEFVTMSRRPAIGAEWYDLYQSDLYNHDRCVVRDGFIARPPRFYDKIFESQNPALFAALKKNRRLSAENNPEATDERRAVKAEHARIQQGRLTRQFEVGVDQPPLAGAGAAGPSKRPKGA